MGLKKLQDAINKRLKGTQVDFSKYLRKSDEEITEEFIVNKVKQKVKLNDYAANILADFSGPEKLIKDPANLTQYLNFEWEQFKRMSDVSLCKNARTFKIIYDSLKKQKELNEQAHNQDPNKPFENPFGENEEMADTAMAYIKSRLQIVASPLYGVINPDVFDRIPSDVLEDIALHQEELVDTAEDLLFDNPLDNPANGDILEDLDFTAFVLNMADLQKKNEALAAETAMEFIEEHENPFVKMLNDTAKELNEKVLSDEEKKVLRGKVENYRRTLIGYEIAKLQLKNAKLHFLDDITAYADHDRICDLAKDFTPEQIKGLFKHTNDMQTLSTKLNSFLELDVPKVEEINVQPNVQAPEPKPHQVWYNSFKQQLKDMGYDNPMAMAMIFVNNQIDTSETGQYQTTFSNAQKYFDLIEKASQPAFMPVDKTGKLEIPRGSENHVEWINNTSFGGLDYVSDEHIQYLYKMAKENRLFIKSDDASMIGYGENRYFHVNEDGSSYVSKPMSELIALSRFANEGDKVDCYTKEEFDQLHNYDEHVAGLENFQNMFVVSTIHSLNNENEKAILEEKLISNLAIKDACAHAHKRPDWFAEQEMAKKLFDVHKIIRKPEDRQTTNDAKLVADYPIVGSEFDTIEKKLLQETGLRSINELSQANLIKSEDDKIITGKDSLEFGSKVSLELLKGKAVFVGNKPFMFDGMYMSDAFLSDGYVQGLNTFSDALKKYSKTLKNKSVGFTQFENGIADLKKTFAQSKYACFGKLQNVVNNFSFYSDTFISDMQTKALSGQKLSSSEIEGIKLAYQFRDFKNEVIKNEQDPKDLSKNYLATKLYNAICIESNNMTALLDDRMREEGIEAIIGVGNQYFSKFNNMSLAEQKELLNKSDADLLKSGLINDYVRSIIGKRTNLKVVGGQPARLEFLAGNNVSTDFKGNYSKDVYSTETPLIINGLFGSKEKFYDHLMHMPELTVRKCLSFYPSYQRTLNHKDVINKLKEAFPEYEAPTDEEFEERVQFTENLRRKYHEAFIKNNLTREYAAKKINYTGPFKRHELWFTDGDCSAEGFERNAELLRKYKQGSPQEKIEAFKTVMDRMTNFDLTKIDLYNPQSILDNMDELTHVINFGGEAQYIVSGAKELGIDLSLPEYKDFVQKAEAVYDFGMTAYAFIDMYTSNAFAYFGDLNRPEIINYDANANLNNSDKTYGAFLNDLGSDFYEKDQSFSKFFAQAYYKRLANSVFSDPSLTPEERLRKFNDMKTDVLHIKYAEGVAPELRKPEDKYFVSDDQAINDMFDKSAINATSAYEVSNARFNPMLNSDWERIYKMVDGKLVQAFPSGLGQPPLVDTAKLTNEMLKDIYTSGNYYILQAGTNNALHIHDGIVDSKATKDVSFKTPRLPSKNESEIRNLETEYFNEIRLGQNFQDLYGKDFNNVGSDAYRSYAQKMTANALKADPNLAYPDSNKFSDLDMQALTCLAYADSNVNGDYVAMGETPEVNAYAALGMGPNDLYILRSGNDNLGERAHNAFVKARFATKKELEAYNAGNPDPIAESIARSIYNIGMAAAANKGLIPKTYAESKSAEMTYNLLTNHKDIYDLARSKAQALGEEALKKFDTGFENCKRAKVMRQLYKKGINAKYRLALYKDDKFVNPEGKSLKITDAEKKALEKDIMVFDTLVNATKKQQDLYGKHPESKRILDKAKQDMVTYPADKMSDFLESRQTYASWLAEKDHDGFIDALSDDAAMKIALEKGTNEKEIRAYAEFEHFKNQLKAHPEMAQQTPEFIKKMAKLKFAVVGIEVKKSTSAAVKTLINKPEIAEEFFSSITDPDFAQHCIGFLEEKDPVAAAAPVYYFRSRMEDLDYSLSNYDKGNPYKYTKGLFMPKTDGSGMLMDFKSKEINQRFKDIQEEIDSIKIDVPKGLTETDVAMATMGLFFNPDLMLKSFNEVKDMNGSTMKTSGVNSVDVQYALENFFQNSLSNDKRANMHDSRKYVPGARRECQKLMEEYANGNHQPFVDAVHRSFKACYDRIKTTVRFDDERFAFCAQTIANDVLILQREGYQFTDEELEVCNIMLTINNTVQEKIKLEKEVFKESANHCYANKSKIGDDPAHKEKVEKLMKLNALQKNAQASVKSLHNAIAITRNLALDERNYQEREITIAEQGFLNPDKMMDAIFQSSINGTEKYNALLNQTHFDFLTTNVNNLTSYYIDSGAVGVDFKFKKIIDHISSINRNQNFVGLEYNRIKTEINQFVANYNEIRNNPNYKHEDLIPLLDHAHRVSRIADSYTESGLDKDNFLESVRSALAMKNEVLLEKITDERSYQKIIDKYEELNGIEKVIPEEKPQPEPIANEELAKAETWFASFSEQLKGIGISYDNPLSLALVKEVNPDLDYQTESDNLRADEFNLNNRLKAIKLVDKKISMAFANDTLKNHTFYGDDYANHLYKNMLDPSKMSPEDKYRLYTSAKNGNLIIANPSTDPGAEQNFRKVRVLEDGSSRITVPVNSAPTGDPLTDLSEDEARNLSMIGGIIQSGQVDLNEIKSQLDDKYSRFENDRFVPRTQLEQKQFEGEFDAYTDPVRWATQRHKLVSRAMQMNTIFNDEASRKKLSDLIRVNSIPVSVRTVQEQEIHEEDFLFRSSNEQLFTTLMKKFKVNSLNQIPLNRISDKDGKSFGTEVNYETLNKLAEATYNAEPFMIDGEYVVYSNNNSAFVKAVNIDEYVKESEKLLKELNKTNSIFSSDSEAYTDFNNTLKTMAENIKALQQVGTADSKTVPTVLAEFDRAKTHCDRYIREHKNLPELSTRQADRLGVMDKFLNLYEKLSNNAYIPNTKQDRIAEDMYVEIAKQLVSSDDKAISKRGQDILSDVTKVKAQTEAFKQNKVYKAMIAKGDEYINKLYNMSGSKMLKEYASVEKQLIKQEEALRKAAALQNQNAPKKGDAVKELENNNQPEVAPVLGGNK